MAIGKVENPLPPKDPSAKANITPTNKEAGKDSGFGIVSGAGTGKAGSQKNKQPKKDRLM
jgi:hypothetical protein